MTLVAEHHNPIAVLDAVIADMRASGDTGHVENLLQARADFMELIKVVEAFVDNSSVQVNQPDDCARAEALLFRIGSTP